MVEAYLKDQQRLWPEVATEQTELRESLASDCEKPKRSLRASLKIRFLADANLNQRIVSGLILREPEIDFALPEAPPLPPFLTQRIAAWWFSGPNPVPSAGAVRMAS